MAAQGTTQVLRERTGNEATHTRITIMDESSRSMAEEIAQSVGDRFERRLTDEIASVRVEMHKGFAELRVEMHKGLGELRAETYQGFSALRAEMHQGNSNLTRWSFLFWVGQVGIMISLFAYMK